MYFYLLDFQEVLTAAYVEIDVEINGKLFYP